MSSLKQLKFIVSQFWKVEAQNDGIDRANLSLKSVEENRSLSLASGGLLAAIDIPWFTVAAPQSLPPSSYVFSLYVCPSLSLPLRIPVE